MRRLYHQLYLTIVASLFVLVLAATAVWRIGPRGSPGDQAIDIAGELISGALPGIEAPAAEQRDALQRLSARLRIDLALYGPGGGPIANAGGPLPPPPGSSWGRGWLRGPGGPAWAFELPDGRWLLMRAPGRHRSPAVGLLAVLGGLALAIALGAYPVVRRLTRRLERLQGGVDKLGQGDLSARVAVEGRDEVARLAASFNRSAERIELVGRDATASLRAIAGPHISGGQECDLRLGFTAQL